MVISLAWPDPIPRRGVIAFSISDNAPACRLFGYMVICMVMWLYGYQVTWLSGYLVIWVIWLSGYMHTVKIGLLPQHQK